MYGTHLIYTWQFFVRLSVQKLSLRDQKEENIMNHLKTKYKFYFRVVFWETDCKHHFTEICNKKILWGPRSWFQTFLGIDQLKYGENNLGTDCECVAVEKTKQGMWVTVVQEENKSSWHKKYTRRRTEIFNSKTVLSPKSAINSGMSERQRHRNKQVNCLLFSFWVSAGESAVE